MQNKIAACSISFSVSEAAELARVKPALLKLWLETAKFKPSIWISSDSTPKSPVKYFFNEADIERLVKFAKIHGKRKPIKKDDSYVDEGTQKNFTVAQVASMLHLSRDTTRRLFQDEPGVVVLGDKKQRGKRKRITLRIPRTVMERVKKRRSNPA
jgi:AraC-like DNA-binding protein